jgi:putative tricarboxylic transport membrane protein
MGKKGEIIVTLFFAFVGIGCIVASLQLPIGTPLDPRPGFFPLLAGGFLVFLSILNLIRAFFKKSAITKAFGPMRKPAFLIASFFIYSFILTPTGYVIATIFLSGAILGTLDVKPWWKLILISLVTSAGSYILFDRILGVTLPLGPLKGMF